MVIGAGGKGFRFARLLGFDFLRDSSGGWWLVEVNDVPADLCAADRLASGVFGTSRIIGSLAQELAGAPSEGTVALLRPPAVLGGDPLCEDFDEDFLALKQAVNCLGRDCDVVTPNQLDTTNGIRLSDGRSISAAFRRTRLRPDCAPNLCTINPTLTSFVCRDKLLAPSVLGSARLSSVPTVLAETHSRLPESESGLWILKPRFGSGSRGVRRGLYADVLGAGKAAGYVLQPWIKPSTVAFGDRVYYFDVRIVALDGEVLGGYARCAAGPVDGVAKGLPLEWLTTTGRRLPIQISTSGIIESAVFIDYSERDLLCDAVRQFARSIETAVECFLKPEGDNFSKKTDSPRHFERAVLYVGGATDSRNMVSCADAVNVTAKCLPRAGICDIDAVTGDWESLTEASGWDLMPQLFAGREHFLGSRVIDEAIRSGEVSRALLQRSANAWGCVDATSCVELVSSSKHEAEVWGVSTSLDGSIRASCSADGSVCVYTNTKVRRYRIGSRWINAVSLSPCGALLAFGTSEPAGYCARILDGAISSVVKLIGNARWVNGALALNDHQIVTCASDGTLALWGASGTFLAATQRQSRGHVLGMLASQEAGRFYVWSSDGVISVHCDRDLATLTAWRAPTQRYVTAATQLVLNGKTEYFAVDAQGKLFGTLASEVICDVGARVWALCPDEATEGLRLFTVCGDLVRVRQPRGDRAVTETVVTAATPTACRQLPSGRVLLGLSSGEVMEC